MNAYDKTKPPLYMLAEIASILRSETGCPWDKEQTHESLKSDLIEEAYEVYDAIESGDAANLKEELGDLLYQVYAHAQMAMEDGEFTIDDVAAGIVNKLVSRHPHVFGDADVKTSAEVLKNWEAIKKKEKAERNSILEGIPNMLPALLKAFRVQEKARRVGFDWASSEDALYKLDEETAEFKRAVTEGNQTEAEDEAGDILFSIVNILRLKGINPEDALRRSVDKFTKRFMHMEHACERELSSKTSEELEALWAQAKKEVG